MSELLQPPHLTGDVGFRVDQWLREVYNAITTLNVRTVQLQGEVGKFKPVVDQTLSSTVVTPALLQTALGLGSTAVVLSGTHASRLNTPAANYPLGTLFYETDRRIEYIVSGSPLVWTYKSGTYATILASIPTDLTVNDAGFLFAVTNFKHVLQWSGSAWDWGPDDIGSDFYVISENALGIGWQLVNGATVDRLNADATVTSVTLDDMTVPGYLKGALVATAVAASSGLTTSVSGGTPAGSVSSTFTGTASGTQAADNTGASSVNVVPAPYTPAGSVSSSFTGSALTGHAHGPNTLELRNKQGRLYYRL